MENQDHLWATPISEDAKASLNIIAEDLRANGMPHATQIDAAHYVGEVLEGIADSMRANWFPLARRADTWPVLLKLVARFQSAHALNTSIN